jgi:hypothetical protein
MRPSRVARWVRVRWWSVLIGTGVAALLWLAFDAVRPRADWLELKASQRLVGGQRARFEVRLNSRIKESTLSLDLHWRTRQRVNRRVLVAGPSRRIESSERDYVFEFDLPANRDLGAVIAVVYVGPSGRWTERSRVAFSDPLEVALPDIASVEEATIETTTELRRIPVFAPEPSNLPPLERSPAMRYLAVALLLLAAAGLAWRPWCAGRRDQLPPGIPGGGETNRGTQGGTMNPIGQVGIDLPPSSRTRDFGGQAERADPGRRRSAERSPYR